MTDSCCVLTYLARRWTTHRLRTVSVFSCRQLWHQWDFWVVRLPPKEHAVFLGTETHDIASWLAARAKWLCVTLAALWKTWTPVRGSDYLQVWEAVDSWSVEAPELGVPDPVGQLNPGFTWSWWTSSRLLPASSRWRSTRLPLVEDQESMWRNRYGHMSESRTLWSCDWQKKYTRSLPVGCLFVFCLFFLYSAWLCE